MIIDKNFNGLIDDVCRYRYVYNGNLEDNEIIIKLDKLLCINGYITSKGDIIANCPLECYKNITANGDLIITGDIEVKGDIEVLGNIKITGNIRTNGNVKVTQGIKTNWSTITSSIF